MTHGKGHESLQWRHNGSVSVSNHQPHDCFLNRLFRRRSKETSKLRVTGLCEGNSPGTGEFPAQMASYAENVSIGRRHHVRAKFIRMQCSENTLGTSDVSLEMINMNILLGLRLTHQSGYRISQWKVASLFRPIICLLLIRNHFPVPNHIQDSTTNIFSITNELSHSTFNL